MQLNQTGIDLVRKSEGCKLTSYPDPASGGAPWTIGWGSTGPDIGPGLTWTQEQADERLVVDLNNVAHRVASLIHVDLTDNQFSALVSFAYNLGVKTLASSTLLKFVNQEEYAEAAVQFGLWNHAGGKVMPGLTARRDAEKGLFLS